MFKDILKGKVMIMGMGNTMRSDDGAGVKLVELLKDKTDMLCIDAGTAPENYLGKIIKEKPDNLLIVDAAEFDGMPGEYRVFKKNEIAGIGFSTHDMSPELFIEYLENESGCGIYMLGIQPEKTAVGIGLTEIVEDSVKSLAEMIISIRKEN